MTVDAERVAPRIYCIPATDAPVVAVLRRGPSRWSHVGRWDLASGRYEPGAWLAGRIFPRRSDLSPDGRYLCYFAQKPTAGWEHGDTYVAISKLPWLTALHAFGTCGTWTRGYCFAPRGDGDESAAALPIDSGLRSIPAWQFATERRRGWIESPDSPQRHPEDMWDQRRNARMQKRQPGGLHVLHVESVGHAGGEFGKDLAVDGLRVRYALEGDRDIDPLPDLQWADWDAQGRLLAATRTGCLQIRRLVDRGPVCDFEADLTHLEPDPQPAPDWAGRW
jgi:hypothetical protein